MRSVRGNAVASLLVVGLALLVGAESAFADLYISGVNATASSECCVRVVANTVDGLEKNTTDPDGTPGVLDGGMWVASGTGGEWAKFDLGAEHPVTRMDIYNYNEPGYVNRGVGTMNVSYSTDDVTYTTLESGYGVTIAPGTAGPWGPSASIDFSGIAVRYVRIDILASHGGTIVGLNEVEFYEVEPGYISGVHATASTVLGQRYPEHLVDGTDKYTTNPDDDSVDPPADDRGMWLSTSLGSEWVKFDLHGVYGLSRMDVWNYNESGYVNRGVGTMNVSYSTDDVTYTPLVTGYAVAIAPGGGGPWGTDSSASVSFGGVQARYVRLDNLTTHGGTIVGLNEVEFYGIPANIPPYISGVHATASYVLGDRHPEHLVDGTDKYTTNPDDSSADPPADDRGMWLNNSPPDTPATAWVKFDLHGVYALSHVDVWNYNETPATDRGVATMNVSYSADDVTYTPVVTGQAVFRAQGVSGPWGRSASINLGGVQARYVRLDTFTTHGSTIVGLNEVELYGTPVDIPPYISVVRATASTELGGTRLAQNMVDGSDKYTQSPDDATPYPPDDGAGMWMTTTDVDQWAKFDFRAPYELSHMDVWNCNEVGQTDRGVATMDVLYSTDDVTYTPVVTGQSVFRTENAPAPWGRSASINLDGITARYVLISNLTDYGDAILGMNEIEFYGSGTGVPEYVTNVQATASSSWGGAGPVYSRDIRHTADGTDKYTTVPDDSDLDPPADGKGMWMTLGPGDTPPDSPATAWAKYDLLAKYPISYMDIYNYNEFANSHRGITTVRVSTSTDDVTYTPLVTGWAVGRGPEISTPWGPSARVWFTGDDVRYVRLDSFAVFGGDVAGLNEVEFYALPPLPGTLILLK